jgi:argonaute-like protein implicated in RNA metabolism and viral defense
MDRSIKSQNIKDREWKNKTKGIKVNMSKPFEQGTYKEGHFLKF